MTALVAVDRHDLGLLLQIAGRYVTGQQPPPDSRWGDWFTEIMEKYAAAAGFGLETETLGSPEDGAITRIRDPHDE